MRKNLVKHGNSMALIIDKPILELIGASDTTPFEITTNGESLVITPVQSKARRAALRAAIEKINVRCADDFRKLAE